MKIFTMKTFYSEYRKKSGGPASNGCKSRKIVVRGRIEKGNAGGAGKNNKSIILQANRCARLSLIKADLDRL